MTPRQRTALLGLAAALHIAEQVGVLDLIEEYMDEDHVAQFCAVVDELAQGNLEG